MFDYIYVEADLPQVPESVVKTWNGSDKIAFQTKNTPNQAMSTYKIDGAGQLYIQKTKGHWEEGKSVSKNASIGEKLASMGRFVVDKEWWEEEAFTGAINFYESITHPEYHDELLSSDDKFLRFEYGWIEYHTLFKNGKLIGDIELVEYKEPKKLSDEELAERIAQNQKRREENEIEQRKRRKEYPSAEQKLIDNIDRECKLVKTIMDETDLNVAISNIRLHIQEYRKKYDRWY